ncbi:MAG: hypothetical protein DWQ01_09560 [Planctomycetota bacterium]|nr:MAG: hypothetical protein DWQ01_09560 [Planctomycetota bacterium]
MCLLALYLNLTLLSQVAGTQGVVLGVVLLPVTITVTPWYAGFAVGNWFPLLISGLALMGLGAYFLGRYFMVDLARS